MQKCIASKIVVIWMDARYKEDLKIADLFLNCKCSVEPVNDLAEYIDDSFVTQINEKIYLRDLLCGSTESKAQMALNELSTTLQTIKSSEQTSLMPWKPRIVGLADNVYPLSAEEDALARFCPMSVEVKATPATDSKRLVDQDVAVLVQALD